MIIFITFLFAIGLFAAVMFTHQKWLVGLMGILFVLCTAVTTLNYTHHFGMVKKTTTSVQTVYPVTNKLPIALYQPVGSNGRDDVYLYKDQPNQAKPQHTQASEKTYSQLKYTKQSSVRLVTKETRWRYRNSFYRFLFMGSGLNGKLIHRHNILYYPRGYVKVSVKQMAKLQRAMKAAAAKAPAGPTQMSPQMQSAMIKQALTNMK